MHLTIVRHGETEENLKRVFQDPVGGTLTAEGHAQAKKLGERLKDEKFDIIYCSDTQRVKDTVEKVLKHHPGVKVVFTKELREQAVGTFAGRPYEEMTALAHAHKGPIEDFKVEGGESYREVQARAIAFVHSILEKKDQRVLILSHGKWIRVLQLHFLGWSRERYFDLIIKNTAMSIFEVDITTKQAKMHLLNCAKHLD
jgi:alpha-ribazole phosphatase